MIPALPLTVYVHFPYCLAKCPYCDFISFAVSPNTIAHELYANAVLEELAVRAEHLRMLGRPIELMSIFFGGGTPSLWAPSALGRVLRGILNRFDGSRQVEVTVECNPSSLDQDRARALRDVGVNRLSIGVQSLDDTRLRFLGRLHNPSEALAALEGALRAGFSRVSADLIYAVAGQTPEDAAREALTLASTGITHLSAYNLTIEAGTRFGELAKRGRLPLAEDETMASAFYTIDEALEGRGFGHYEVSNYAQPGQQARHNLGYWSGLSYLGLGCAAYGTVPVADLCGYIRYRNAIDPKHYVEAATARLSSKALFESQEGLVESVEELSADVRFKERIMLGLRLAQGFNLAQARDEFGATVWTLERERTAARLIQRGRLLREGDVLRIPRESWIFADGIAAELF